MESTPTSTTTSTTTTTSPYAHVLHQPFFDALKDSKRILFAGCGGGYDFMSAIPLFYAFEKAGATCFLANLTFSSHYDITDTDVLTPVCYKITTKSRRTEKGWSIQHETYWPEAQVTHWFQNHENRSVPIYMLLGTGVVPLSEAYATLIQTLNLDTVVLCDGGTDSLMFGNECGLGTPTEDMASICAVHQLKNVKKFLVNLGFGVDCFHGVVHSHYLENVATLSREGGFLGSFSLIHTMEEAKKFEAIYIACCPGNSIVCSSVLSAVQGKFGNTHSPYTKYRTEGSNLYISPLMAMYFTFSLDKLAPHILYLDQLKDTQKQLEVRNKIHQFCEENGYFKKNRYLGDRPSVTIPY